MQQLLNTNIKNIQNKSIQMKNLKLLICAMLAVMAFASCSDSETYADQKKKERSAINRYIANQHVKVISEDQFKAQNCTTDTTQNEFVLFESTGVYMQIQRLGCGEKLKDGETANILCRFNEYNLLQSDSALQCTNIYQYNWCNDKMTVKNTSGTFTGVFSTESCVMYLTYGSTAVPSGWLVPLSYVNLGRFTSEDAELAKVRLIVPHTEGQSNASQSVYPCLYEITYERGR